MTISNDRASADTTEPARPNQGAAQKKPGGGEGEGEEEEQNQQHHERFSPEEEKSLLDESNSHKAEANALFASGKYEIAINKYGEAVTVCPNYLDYELAVLRSNIAACHLKLEEWKDAVSSATAALDGLERVEQQDAEKAKAEAEATRVVEIDDDDAEEEIISAGASKAGPALTSHPDVDSAEAAQRKRQDDVARIRAKALMRRARARSELSGWSNLEGAVEDYKRLSAMTNLAPADRKIVQAQLRQLPPRAKAAQETETAEMWAKLKDLGNGLLKPFGLSTDNFKMVKDENTGAYSMNFQGAAGNQT